MEIADMDSLNNKSESFTEKLEKLEKRSGCIEERKKLSKNVRAVFYKIQSMERAGNPQPKLKKQYEEIIEKNAEGMKKVEESDKKCSDAFIQLENDIDSLLTESGEKLAEKKIDGNIIDGIEAVNQGVEKALKKIFEELADTIKMIVSPEEWEEIAKALKKIMMNPIEFVENMIMFLKEEFGHIVRDIGVIKDNSTTSGLAVEMGQYIPQTCLPLIVSSIGQGKLVKFLKYIKADKLIPEKLMKKLEGMGKEENTKMYFNKKKLEDIRKVDILDWNFDFKNYSLPLSNANKNIERLSYYMDLNYLQGVEGRFDKVLKTLDEMSDYIMEKGNDIMDSTLKDDFQQNFNRLRKRMGEIEN